MRFCSARGGRATIMGLIILPVTNGCAVADDFLPSSRLSRSNAKKDVEIDELSKETISALSVIQDFLFVTWIEPQ